MDKKNMKIKKEHKEEDFHFEDIDLTNIEIEEEIEFPTPEEQIRVLNKDEVSKLINYGKDGN
ncbi:MAG: hypothetical protein ACM3UU_09120 [Ignavibacteriales bacterium]